MRESLVDFWLNARALSLPQFQLLRKIWKMFLSLCRQVRAHKGDLFIKQSSIWKASNLFLFRSIYLSHTRRTTKNWVEMFSLFICSGARRRRLIEPFTLSVTLKNRTQYECHNIYLSSASPRLASSQNEHLKYLVRVHSSGLVNLFLLASAEGESESEFHKNFIGIYFRMWSFLCPCPALCRFGTNKHNPSARHATWKISETRKYAVLIGLNILIT